MKRATKEKKSLNNRKKVNNQKERNKRIFDYEQETKQKQNQPRKKLTRKANSGKTKKNQKNKQNENYNANKEQIKENKKKIKKIQKRKKEENLKRKKEIKREQKKENETKNKIVYKKLNSKQIKQRKRINKLIRMLLIILIIIGSVLLLVLSPIFNIKEIKVVGNEKVSSQEIISLLKIGNNTNIFKETENEVKLKLKENAYIDIEKTTIRRKLPEVLEINVKEREIELLLEFGSSYGYIDKNGYILEISTNNLDDKIKILGYETSEEYIKPGNRLCDKDMVKINDVCQIINISKNFEIYDKITSINISDENDYTLFLKDEGKTVHLGNCSGIDTKMLYIKAIMEKEKGNEGEIFVNVDLNKKNAYFKQNV